MVKGYVYSVKNHQSLCKQKATIRQFLGLLCCRNNLAQIGLQNLGERKLHRDQILSYHATDYLKNLTMIV